MCLIYQLIGSLNYLSTLTEKFKKVTQVWKYFCSEISTAWGKPAADWLNKVCESLPINLKI